MFLSADDLKLAYGVDMQIARCYVDRKVPHQNAYWEKRHLYIPPVIGYYFMPIFSDLAFRVGVPKSELLSDAFLVLAERILDSAARLEKKYISWVEHVDECLAMAAEPPPAAFVARLVARAPRGVPRLDRDREQGSPRGRDGRE